VLTARANWLTAPPPQGAGAELIPTMSTPFRSEAVRDDGVDLVTNSAGLIYLTGIQSCPGRTGRRLITASDPGFPPQVFACSDLFHDHGLTGVGSTSFS
jgi:hypothetical protein